MTSMIAAEIGCMVIGMTVLPVRGMLAVKLHKFGRLVLLAMLMRAAVTCTYMP